MRTDIETASDLSGCQVHAELVCSVVTDPKLRGTVCSTSTTRWCRSERGSPFYPSDHYRHLQFHMPEFIHQHVHAEPQWSGRWKLGAHCSAASPPIACVLVRVPARLTEGAESSGASVKTFELVNSLVCNLRAVVLRKEGFAHAHAIVSPVAAMV